MDGTSRFLLFLFDLILLGLGFFLIVAASVFGLVKHGVELFLGCQEVADGVSITLMGRMHFGVEVVFGDVIPFPVEHTDPLDDSFVSLDVGLGYLVADLLSRMYPTAASLYLA